MSLFINSSRLLALYRHEISHSHQIVGRGGEGEGPGQPLSAPMAVFAEMTYGLQPAKDFFHPFAQPLAQGVSSMPGGAAIQGRATSLPGHMGHGPAAPEFFDEVLGVVVFVAADADPAFAWDSLHHFPGGIEFSDFF